MALPRASTDTASRTPHSVSLKVLRLSRPALSTQHPLPRQDSNEVFPIDANAGLSTSSQLSRAGPHDQFMLTPNLRLPSSFGAIHVGETFLCTLCVNNELPVQNSSPGDDSENELEVSNVSLSAEMQLPVQEEPPVPLALEPSSDFDDMGTLIAPGETMQRLVRFHLSDEGMYVLSATVSYLETRSRKREDGEIESSSRSRSFRKLYQFPTTQVLRVRVKTRILPTFLEKRLGKGYAVEAQLEKLGDDSLVLESVTFGAKSAFRVQSLNAWDDHGPSARSEDGENEGFSQKSKPMLSAGDVLQAAFLLLEDDARGIPPDIGKDGRVTLGQISLLWRGAMGESGSLSTGMLSTRAG